MKVLSNFWKLYGAGVLGHKIIDFGPMTAEQWTHLRQLARRNKLSGVVLDGLSTLPPEMKPPGEVIDKWILEVAQCAYSHWDHNRVIADLFRRWHAVGLHPVLLKGQGYARLYPTPSRRMIGDIDVFVCRDEFDRALEVVRSLDLDSDELPDIGKHIEFFYRHKAIELHRRSAEIFHRMNLDAQYQEWSETVLPVSTTGFYIDETGRYADSGEWIATPPPTFNAFYTFMHLWGHMYIGSISIRSLADWILFLKNNKAILDLEELEQKLRQFDLLRYWQILGCFVVRYMGVDPSVIPFYSPKEMKYVNRYFRYFYKELTRPSINTDVDGTLNHKFRVLKRHSIYCYRRLGIYPFMSVAKEFYRVMRFGVKGIMKHD